MSDDDEMVAALWNADEAAFHFIWEKNKHLHEASMWCVCVPRHEGIADMAVPGTENTVATQVFTHGVPLETDE